MTCKIYSSFPSFERKVNQVAIWDFSLDFQSDFLTPLLSKEEKIRAKRFHFNEHRNRFIAAHGTLRLILSRYNQIDPAKIQIFHNKQGKPFLKETLQFNLSHSRNRALLAVGEKAPLGIDIEYFSARSYLGIADYLFSKEEIDCLKSLKKMQMAQGFFSIWTQKESLMKACGVGLSYPTKALTLQLFPNRNYTFIDPVDEKEWKMISFFPEVGALAALCIEPNVNTVIHYKITPNQIVNWFTEYCRF